ncbi:SEC10/PgrA surface exclusion domain-containing protein [Streptococcus suis]|uniref:SEC10/PgrA surface exclusion domain-containing protein n=1 Tax=Streptococcus suis TaxID=1307 RepID=UPI000417CCA2|nr:SEC10/PgrA surface exclusion domain-containing protein [Streptococcus suis]
MGKKLIKSTAIGVATLSSFVIANGVHAEEAVNTPTSPVESPEVSLTASVGIETVSGVIVTNGTAVVTETPTEATVNQAATIKTAAGQAVTDQTAVVVDASVAEENAANVVKRANEVVAEAETNKAEARDENIAKAETRVADTQTAISEAESKATKAAENTAEAQAKADDAQAKVNSDKVAIDAQETVVDNAQTAVDNAQAVLDGTGKETIIAECDAAASDLEVAKAAETKAQSDLATAQAADAKKASDIASHTETQAQQQATAKQTTGALAQAQADAKTKADAKTATNNKVAELTANIAAFDNLTTPKLSQDVIDAYKAFAKDESQSNKDALFNAVNTWYTTDMVGYTKTMVTPIDTTIVDPSNLTEEQVTALSQYYVYIENAVRKQIWGSNNEDVIVTKDAVQAAMQIAKNYTAENDNTGDHSYTALKNDGNNNVSYNSEGIAFISTKTTTMTQLYRNIFSMSINTWAGDYNQNYAHITNEYWTRSISSSSSSSTTKFSGAFVTSVTPGGFGRAHSLQFLDG